MANQAHHALIFASFKNLAVDLPDQSVLTGSQFMSILFGEDARKFGYTTGFTAKSGTYVGDEAAGNTRGIYVVSDDVHNSHPKFTSDHRAAIAGYMKDFATGEVPPGFQGGNS